MSRERKHHDHAHAHDHEAEQEADQHGEHDTGAHDRKRPEAGVRSDVGRYGEEEMSDVKGRILGISIVHGQTELLIGAGRQQGVFHGMPGYLMGKDTYVAELNVVGVSKNTCRATVDATPDMVREHLDGVVINPSSAPARSQQKIQGYESRVLKVDVVDGKTRITCAGGTAQGLQAGMQGVMLDEGGHRILGFTVQEAHARTTVAIVDTIVSEVYRSKSVVFNPAGAGHH